MGELEWSRDRRSESTDGSAPAVGSRLRRLLADLPTPFPCDYACFIHARRRQGEHGFGVITVTGESLPLTVAMLRSLRRVPTLFEGRTRVVIGPGDQEESMIPAPDGAGWGVQLPVAHLSMRMGIEDAPGWGPEQVLTPTAEGPQLTLLCEGRPAGWPA
jgi:hypothetical protein